MQRRFLRFYCDAVIDDWFSSLTLEERGAYLCLNLLIHNNTNDGKAEFSWNTLLRLLGLRSQNRRAYKLIRKFHDSGRIIWENHEQFTEYVKAFYPEHWKHGDPIPRQVTAKKLRELLPKEMVEGLSELDRNDVGILSELYRNHVGLSSESYRNYVGKVRLFSPKLLKYYDSSVYRKKRENNRDIDKREKTENTPSVLQQNLSKSSCQWCGAPLTTKKGPYGQFASCSRFPDCRYKQSIKDNDWREDHSTDGPTVSIQQSEGDVPLTPEEQEKAKPAREKCMREVDKHTRNFGKL